MRPRFTTEERQAVLNKTGGKCFHCHTELDTVWDVDHHPIPYRDIEDQCCWGVTDPKDFSNLVPSCRSCNRSHQYEQSQVRCRKSYYVKTFLLVCACAVGYTAGHYLR